MKTSKQISTALGAKHVQGDVLREWRQFRTEKRDSREVCTQHPKKKSSKSFPIMQLRVQCQVCQSCSGSLSKCIKCRQDQATCPNVASPHINKLKYQIYSTGIRSSSAVTTCMCCTIHDIPCNQCKHAHSILLSHPTFMEKQNPDPQVTCAHTSVSVPLKKQSH